MSLPSSVAQLQRQHVVMELECIDRMYINAYIPKLTTEGGIASFFRGYLGHRFASTKAAAPITDAFIRAIRDFIHDQDIPLVKFRKGQRKDSIFQKHLRQFKAQEGVVFVGVAQEKVRVPRTIRKSFGQGGSIPWIDYTTAMVNVYYFYCKDKDFGPFFLKFCSYFPYTAKLCLNGHEYLKCQLTQRQICFEALDNGLLSCADLKAAQRLCDGLDSAKIDAFFRKWLRIDLESLVRRMEDGPRRDPAEIIQASEKVHPERWLETSVKEAGQRFHYFPFGGGIRRCIGESFAWTEGVLLLATLARKWKFELVPDQKIGLQPMITLRPKHGMRMKVISRS